MNIGLAVGALAVGLAPTLVYAETTAASDADEPPAASEAKDEPAAARKADATADEAGGFTAAVGISGGVLRRNDYGDRIRSVFVPELVGFAYLGTPAERFYLRPGLRIGYSRFGGADMPGELRFSERDQTLAAELGVLYDGVVIPALSGGAGVRLRRVDLALGRSVDAQAEPISRWEALPAAFVQLAVGVPINTTPIVVEPYARFEHIVSDDRSRWRLGLDVTFEIAN